MVGLFFKIIFQREKNNENENSKLLLQIEKRLTYLFSVINLTSDEYITNLSLES